ncbi:MAG: HTTM domain-containing protein [Fimbriimonadaceae bacterium]|nr:HTTM domain-containing protein [Fimbriimonadaceae bacterium]
MSDAPKGLKSSLKRLDEYWFGHGSPVTLGVIRMVIGFFAFTNLLMVSIDFDAWFTERGFVPQAFAKIKMPNLSPNSTLFGMPIHLPFDEIPRINLLWGVTDTRVTIAVYVLTILAALLTMLGLWTRAATIFLAVGTASIHLRNGMIVHGGDSVMRVMCLYLAIAPSGAACSLDRLIGLWKGKIAPEIPKISMWSQRLIAYNIALVYFTTFWHKMRGDFWRNGTATWYPARLHEFDRFYVPSFFSNPPMIYLTTYGTLIVELALGTLVFYRPLRKWVLLSGLVMHTYIEYSMNIPLFAFIICSCYVSFYDGEEVTAWARKLGDRFARFKVRIATPGSRSFLPGPSAVLESVDAFGMIDYEVGTESDWKATTKNGRSLPAARASWTRSPAVWAIGWIPGVWSKVMNGALGKSSDTSTPKEEVTQHKVATP